MKKRIISLLCATVMAAGLAAGAAAEGGVLVYRPISYQHFDTLQAVGESSGNHTGEIGSVYMQGKPTAPIETAQAPGGKRADTNLSTDPDAEDKAIAIVLGDKGNNPYFNVSFANNELRGRLKLAFNVYVPSRTKGNYGLLALDIRDGAQNYHNLLSVRGNNDVYRLFPDGNSNNPKEFGTVTPGRWYYFEYKFDADENTYDVYVDGKLQGEGTFPLYPKDKEIVYNAFRFSTSNNSNNGLNLKNTSILIDDIFFGSEAEAPVPEFLSTENAAGEESTEFTDVETDLSVVNIQFPVQMAPESFENNVTMTRGRNQTEVAFEGTYDAAAKVYSARILEQVMPCMDYTLNFGEKIYAADRTPLGSDQSVTISTKMVPFAVVDGYFTETAESKEPLKAIPAGAEKVYANVTSVVTDLLTVPQDITMLVFCYEKGQMKQVWLKKTVLESTGADPLEETIQLELPLDGITVDADTELEISVWDSYMNMLPLAKSTAVQGE